MNIFFREIKANFKSLLIWSGIIAFFTIMGVGEFSAYYENPDMLRILNGLPPAMLDVFNMNSFNLTTITGYYGVIFPYYALIVSIFAIMLGTEIVSKEERDKTAEFSLTLPVTRSKVITEKILASVVNCVALTLFTWFVIWAFTLRFHPDKEFYDFLVKLVMVFFILEILFLSIGFLFSCAMKQHKRSSSVAVSLLLGTYILSILSVLSKDLEFLKYLSPFTYFDPVKLLNESRLDLNSLWLSGGIIFVAFGLAYITYSKRDLNI